MAKMNLKNKIILSFLFFFLLGQGVEAQSSRALKYFISFKDKATTKYSLSSPQTFLSARAISRRQKQQIPVTERDLPVSQTYIDQVKATGAVVWYSSRWMNGVLIEATPAVLKKIQALSFVKGAPILTKSKATEEPENLRKRTFTYLSGTNEQKVEDGTRSGLVIEQMEDYGKSFGQVSMLGADEMHQSGHRGQGMVVAIFDAGFNNVDEIPAFKHLFKEQRILGTYDFVKHEESVFEDDDHGRMVLSCIAAYDRGQMIGTAPEASFYLFRTEDAYSEYRVEEYNWLVAAEKADSLGVDVINSSLGYNNFDDATMSYRYEDMDGKTAIISQAAEFASEVGMIVVSSAGNEGGNKWKYITAPADAPSVLSVGAVTSKQKIAYFSSRGNTSDGRIKPDLVAQGQSTRVVKRDGSVGAASGTSFSAPVMCGLVTSFWGANPQLTSRQVVSYLKRAGSQSVRPDSTYGYGLPSYITAQNLVNRELGPYGLLTGKNANAFQVFPNPVEAGNIPTIAWGANYQPKALEIQVFDNAARKLVTIKVNKAGKETTLPMLNQLPKGEYLIQVNPALSDQRTAKLIIQ